jgi:hypothetical protein
MIHVEGFSNPAASKSCQQAQYMHKVQEQSVWRNSAAFRSSLLRSTMLCVSCRSNAAPRIAYEHRPCDDCELNVNKAFDVQFDAVLRSLPPQVWHPETMENHVVQGLGGVPCKCPMTIETDAQIRLIAIYARVSTARQKDENTIETQLLAIREFAKSNGYNIVQEYHR